MEPLPVFLMQFLWFFICWAAMAYFVVWPWSLKLFPDSRLLFWFAPQIFRALGLGLLVPNLAPGISQEFALPTATIDFFMGVLAFMAFIGIWNHWRLARFLTWACTIIGLGDLFVAFSVAPFIGLPNHLTAQWYIPAFVGPFMIVAHLGCLSALLRKEDSAHLHESLPIHPGTCENPEFRSFTKSPTVVGGSTF